MSVHSDKSQIGSPVTAKKATALAILGVSLGTIPAEFQPPQVRREAPLTPEEKEEYERRAQEVIKSRQRSIVSTGAVDPMDQRAPRRAFFA